MTACESETLYSFSLVRTSGRSYRPTFERVMADGYALTEPARCWGSFSGLFGLGSNEFIVMLSGTREALASARTRVAAVPGVAIETSYLLKPTVRPTDAVPLSRGGLYVFRFFDVAHRDVGEIVRLSAEAWPSFEATDAYRAEAQALFAEHEHEHSAERGAMLLVTWYDGFGSWQSSRSPAPGASDSFGRRRELAGATIAYATSLIVG